jgi:hypothetical protein
MLNFSLIGQSRARKTSHVFEVPKILKASKSFRYVTRLMELKLHQISSIVYVRRRRRRLCDLADRLYRTTFLANAHLGVVTRTSNSQNHLDIVEVPNYKTTMMFRRGYASAVLAAVAASLAYTSAFNLQSKLTRYCNWMWQLDVATGCGASILLWTLFHFLFR